MVRQSLDCNSNDFLRDEALCTENVKNNLPFCLARTTEGLIRKPASTRSHELAGSGPNNMFGSNLITAGHW